MRSESLDHDTYCYNRLALNEIAMNNRLFYRPRVVKVNFFLRAPSGDDNFFFFFGVFRVLLAARYA